MGRFIEALLQIVLISFCIMITSCCHDRHDNQQLFEFKALNDSLELFISGAVDVPEANYPTCVYVFAYHADGRDYIDFQSYPGHEMYVPLDSSMKHYKTGIYHGRFLKVYLSNSMKKVFKTKTLKHLELNRQERAVLETVPVDLNGIWFEAENFYRRYKHYTLAAPDSIHLGFQSWDHNISR